MLVNLHKITRYHNHHNQKDLADQEDPTEVNHHRIKYKHPGKGKNLGTVNILKEIIMYHHMDLQKLITTTINRLGPRILHKNTNLTTTQSPIRCLIQFRILTLQRNWMRHKNHSTIKIIID